ncbi:hypothetical protein [Okeania sp. KiyG1]|uniref:hypothetical protein n=1 Tax=Okeania sp. KiyG1 TaxID=2720165 RepID=UPI0019209D50|nr:hypothetical protein [Okeania sp. KiyG1]
MGRWGDGEMGRWGDLRRESVDRIINIYSITGFYITHRVGDRQQYQIRSRERTGI